MKKLKFFAMLVLTSLAAVSFTSCGSDDDDVFDYDNFESCTWEQLSSKANFLSNFPELDGTFSDGSVILNTPYEDSKEADMVSFTYNISSNDLDAYIQKLADNKFCVTRLGNYLLADKVDNNHQYSLQYTDGLFTIMAIKFLNSSDYENALEDYEERLANSTPTNATWQDVVSEYEWLNNLPAPAFRFTNYRLVSDGEIALTGNFSLVSREQYAQKLEADGFVEMPETSRSMFKKEFEDGGYYVVTMNEVMIDFRDFTNTDNDAILPSSTITIWNKLVREYSWLKNFPTPSFNFSTAEVVNENHIRICDTTKDLSGSFFGNYGNELIDYGFEKSEYTVTTLSKTNSNGGVYEVYIVSNYIHFINKPY